MGSLVTIHFGVRVDHESIQTSGLVSTSMTHMKFPFEWCPQTGMSLFQGTHGPMMFQSEWLPLEGNSKHMEQTYTDMVCCHTKLLLVSY